MHLSTTAALATLALACSSPVCAWDGWDGEPALRLPATGGVEAWPATPSPGSRAWVHDLAQQLVFIARPRPPELHRRGDAAVTPATERPAERLWLIERTRTALTAHRSPFSLGHWKLGAAMGLHRALPGAGARAADFAAMPMASYEQAHYRVNLGLVPPSGERASALLLGLTIPLH